MELQPNCDLTLLSNIKRYGLKSIKCEEPVMGFCLIAVSGNWYEGPRSLPVMGFLYTTINPHDYKIILKPIKQNYEHTKKNIYYYSYSGWSIHCYLTYK